MTNPHEPKLYAIRFVRSQEDGGYIATVPKLPGCSAFGETIEAAEVEARHAIAAWLEACRAAGNPVPWPDLF
jgi:predicted RNase H-like HicB family nuclease